MLSPRTAPFFDEGLKYFELRADTRCTQIFNCMGDLKVGGYVCTKSRILLHTVQRRPHIFISVLMDALRSFDMDRNTREQRETVKNEGGFPFIKIVLVKKL